MELSLTDFTLPELGENISAGDILRILVKPGDMLAKDQPVLELETDKATIEVPSSVAGQVKQIKVKAGDKVKVGQAILSVDDGEGAQAQKTGAAKAAPTSPAPPAPEPSPTPASETQAAVPEEGALDQHVEETRAAGAQDEPRVKDTRADAGHPEVPDDPET